MTTLITGGTGFLGSYVARHLVQEKGERDVVLFDRVPTPVLVEEIADDIHIVSGDITEPFELIGAVRRFDVDKIVQIAFIVGGGTADPSTDSKNRDNLAPYLRVQCMGTANVFECATSWGSSGS
jgi:nucleoside-diphosphate-sugar epimerase